MTSTTCPPPMLDEPAPRGAATPYRMPTALVGLFAIACGASVANVYYAQPLLEALARDFGIGHAAVGGVITATQVGCALALLLLVPLGDRIDRRRLMAAQCLALITSLAGVAAAQSTLQLLAGMLAVGMLGTAMTQGLLAYAANAAGSDERGRVVGAAQGGVLLGLLLARVLAGAVSDLAGWRGVYLTSAAVMLIVALLLGRRLPRLDPVAQPIRYTRLIGSMLTMLRDNRVLQVRGLLALLMFAAFNVFWSALVLPLSAPPHSLSATQIGAFGLVGAVGALMAAYAGRWADRGLAQRTSALALLLLLVAWWPLSSLAQSASPTSTLSPIWSTWLPLIVGIILLDIGGQALHVTNQSLILRAPAPMHGRLIALYMLFYAIGSGLGAIAATFCYARAGWAGVCGLGATISALALIVWALTRRSMAGASC